MHPLPRVTHVEHLGAFRLRVTFSDQLVRELDFDGLLDDGVMESLAQPGMFSQVFVDEEAGTLAWPTGVDLDPDVLHGDHVPVTGRSPKVLREYHLRPAG